MKTKRLSTWQANWQEVALPIVLMLTGLILLGGDYIGVLSLDRIQDLWPLAVIVIGLAELVPLSGRQRTWPERSDGRQLQ